MTSPRRIALIPSDGIGREGMPEGINAIERLLADPEALRTPDMGGKATTAELGDALVQLL